MENIANFLDICYEYGCSKEDMFQTVDLFEAQNIPQVLCLCWHQLTPTIFSNMEESLWILLL